MPSPPTCSNCPHWHEEVDANSMESRGQGQCRATNPTHMAEGSPEVVVTSPDYWCGVHPIRMAVAIAMGTSVAQQGLSQVVLP
jgi:hypothetical protein